MSRTFVVPLKRFIPIVLGSSLLLAGCFIGTVWWKARRVLNESAARQASSESLSFTLTPWNSSAYPNTMSSYSVGGEFASGAWFEGDLYLTTSSTLYRFDPNGRLRQEWHVGRELPPFRLGQLTVRQSVAQPELWIGTSGGGALIWDTNSIRQLLPASHEIGQITSLLALKNGSMLLGTLNAGLYLTDGKQLALFHPQFKGARVTALLDGGAGRESDVWVGTREEGLWYWHEGTVTRFVAELPDPQVLSLAAGDDGAVFAGTPLGVSEMQSGRFRRKLAEGVFAGAVTAQSGTLWIGTMDEGVMSLDLHIRAPRPALATTPTAQSTASIRAFLHGSDQVWALSNDAVLSLPDGSPLVTEPKAVLSSGHIAALNLDSSRRLWVGYFDRGLDVFPASSGGKRHFEDDVLFCVNRIKQDPVTLRTLAATANGLAFFDATGTPRQVMTARSGLIASHVTDILFRTAPDGSPTTVVATPAGLTFIEAGSTSSVYAFQGLVNNHVYTLAQTGDTLLAGTLGGFSLLRQGIVKASYTTANSSLRQNWITASTPYGNSLFLGTYGSGVIQLDDQFAIHTFKEFASERIEINPNAMLTSSRGVYAGTADKGLAFLPAGDTRWRFYRSGLPSMNVTALALDRDDIYIGTDNGLVRIPEGGLLP